MRSSYETVILGAGPAGSGSLVWAAQHGLLGSWLDDGVAVVERRRPGGSLGDYRLTADSMGQSFLEALEGPCCEPLLDEVRADPVTAELERFRDRLPSLELVDRFQRRLGAAFTAEFTRRPDSRLFTGTTALAIQLEPSGSVGVVVADQHGRRDTIRAGSAVLALGGRQNTEWAGVELVAGVRLSQWRSKILTSHQLLSHGGVEQAERLLGDPARAPRVVIVGGAHSAFSSVWMLLERVCRSGFDSASVRVLYRSTPRVAYGSREEAHADSYRFTESDVCQATGRVHRLGGLRGDGREVWRRMHGKPGTTVDRRAVAEPIENLSVDELTRTLDMADLIVPALGYRLATLPVFDQDFAPVALAGTGPAVGPDAQLLGADGSPIPGLFGVGLGSGFEPPGAMAGEESFTGQQNSLWLYQHGLGELIYHATRERAAALRLDFAARKAAREREFHSVAAPVGAAEAQK